MPKIQEKYKSTPVGQLTKSITLVEGFKAPEQICEYKLGEKIQDIGKVDVWSLGVIIFKIETGKFPFDKQIDNPFQYQ